VEVAIAYELERPFGVVRGDPVGAGCGERARSRRLRRGSRRYHVREGKRELVQELWIGCAEMEGDRTGAVVHDDASAEVAVSAMFRAGVGADDAFVEADSGRGQLEIALDRPADIGRHQTTAGRVADVAPQME